MQRNSAHTHSTLGPLRWAVPSTKPGVLYEVAADTIDGQLRCNCPARATVCRHIRAVIAGDAGKPRVRFQPCPPRPTDDLYGKATVSGPIVVRKG